MDVLAYAVTNGTAVQLDVLDDLNGNAGASLAYWTATNTGWDAQGVEDGPLRCALGDGGEIRGWTLCVITVVRPTPANGDGQWVVQDRIAGATLQSAGRSDTRQGPYGSNGHMTITRWITFV